MTQIIIGTRGSQLALWQANHVAGLLSANGVESRIEVIRTTGDADQKSDFASLGAKGVFVKEIEQALLEKRIDIAVHSLKDLPTLLPDELELAAALEREAPYDALVARNGMKFDELPEGAKIATGSLRRAAQALHMRPDLQVGPLRGNVPTRIQKIHSGEADATFLALAGLRRLDLESEATDILGPERVTPSMGQGAVAIETRRGEFDDELRAIEHAPTRRAVNAERKFLARIGGGCRTPVGVLVERSADAENWKLIAALASADGKSLIRKSRDLSEDSDWNAEAEVLAAEMHAEADDAIRATLTH